MRNNAVRGAQTSTATSFYLVVVTGAGGSSQILLVLT